MISTNQTSGTHHLLLSDNSLQQSIPICFQYPNSTIIKRISQFIFITYTPPTMPPPRPRIYTLSPSTTHRLGTHPQSIAPIIRSELTKPTPSPYIVFSHVPPTFIDKSKHNPHKHLGTPSTRITYDEVSRILIVKIPSPLHTRATAAFTYQILASLDNMGLLSEVNKRRRTRVTDMLVSKEPDSSFARRDCSDGWPSVVVECGWWGSLGHLRRDVEM
ncbi:hypothetical protein BO94DRAFT_623213 [Aspergillus sclerotioniger CBS 115572]|uniref:Uncharacterized protein n=1 Tax=Aspergillus sclerotioniger CBS 115572 TaxID=1450535 RepID=A0A317WX04_9EURO|nr:hypothetical protein BO94DRAFT_623213 [Aspergillus sclerotioniger CBS 115572]PWY90431.1 hypothetical protein BO94DRAFT_623213 [Aspergillus sclerotioniger CBS 115572]